MITYSIRIENQQNQSDIIALLVLMCVVLRIINCIYYSVEDMTENKTDNTLNLVKLKRLIDSGIASIPVDKKHQNAVLVIGDTGVGKTTILSFLAKRKLYIKIHGLNTILDSDDQDGLKIGHDKFSQTRVPSKIVIDNLVFFDCSGFKDNRGEQYEISNSFFVQRLFDIYTNIKILLIVDESSVSESRADKLPKLVRNLLKSFSSLVDIQDGVILLVNRAKPQFSEKTYSEQLLKMARMKGEDGYMFNQQERNFIEFLVKNKRVCLFKQAQKEDEGKVLNIKEENLLNLIRDTNFVKSKKIKNIISESAKLSIRDFVDHLAEGAQPKIQKLCQQIVKDFSYKSHSAFTDAIAGANQTKKRIAQFAKQVEKTPDNQLIQTIRQNVNVDATSFEQDVGAVLFFKGIYNKSDYYFKLIRSSIASTLSKMLLQVDEDIVVLEKQQKLMNQMAEKAAQALKKEQLLKQQLQAYKKKQQDYNKQITQSNKKHTQRINQLEIADDQKANQIVTLRKQIEQISKQYDNLKTISSQEQKKQTQLKAKLDSKTKQIDQLTKLINELKLENQSHADQIDMMSEENHGLRKELQNIILLPQASADKSQSSIVSNTSKTSKYPDVVCPHLKNGGKCIHCIKAWKAEQKELKKQQQHI